MLHEDHLDMVSRRFTGGKHIANSLKLRVKLWIACDHLLEKPLILLCPIVCLRRLALLRQDTDPGCVSCLRCCESGWLTCESRAHKTDRSNAAEHHCNTS